MKDIMINISKTTALIALITAIAAPIAGAAILHYRMGEAERRIQKVEDNVKWQNDVLWEIRSDLKVISRGPVRSGP